MDRHLPDTNAMVRPHQLRVIDGDASPASAVRSVAPPPPRDDEAIVRGLRAGETWAQAALFEQYAPPVERILRKILGQDKHTEIADLVHDTFVQALSSLHRLRDAGALLAWMQVIAAHTAHRHIRARRARRWLLFWEPADLPEVPVTDLDGDVREAYARTYAILDRLSPDDRIAFVLRHIEGMELTQVAEVCEVSLATIKRRIARADARFAVAAARDPVLREWLEEGGRWT
jgi:RNA polymerase sigma-70 factor (ECF subfamily)